MSAFVDTSALLAVVNADDAQHPVAADRWRALVERDIALVTTNYVVVETLAVAQSRQGLPAVRALQQEVLPIMCTEWVTPEDHAQGIAAVLSAGRRRLSLVDAVSFVVMRRLGIREFVGFDPHFGQHGFLCWQP